MSIPATYTFGNDPGNNLIDRVRLFISDTELYFDQQANAMVMQLSDQSIQFYLQEAGEPYEAAASCAEQIAATYASKGHYSKSIGDVHVTEAYQKQHLHFLEIAQNIRTRKIRYNPFGIGVNPNSLKSFAETGIIPQTTEFWTGQFDNLNPVGGADPDVNSIAGA